MAWLKQQAAEQEAAAAAEARAAKRQRLSEAGTTAASRAGALQLHVLTIVLSACVGTA
jgi:hypothetical protein